jgi:hypothetical protein
MALVARCSLLIALLTVGCSRTPGQGTELRPPEGRSASASVRQSISKNAHNFPLGTGWNRVGDIPAPNTCFSTTSNRSLVRQDEFVGSAFLLSKKTEISEKLGASLKAGLPKDVFPLDIELKLENELKTTQTKGVDLILSIA